MAGSRAARSQTALPSDRGALTTPGCSAARVANRFRAISGAFLRRLHAARKVFEQRRNALRVRDTEQCHDDECSVRPIKVLVCHQCVSHRAGDAFDLVHFAPHFTTVNLLRRHTQGNVPFLRCSRGERSLAKHEPWRAARHRDQKSSVTAVNELLPCMPDPEKQR